MDFIIKFMYILFCKIICRVEYVNEEKKNLEGKAVLCANHISYFDVFGIYFNNKNCSAMAKAELFKWKPFAKLLNYAGVFPIKRGEKDARSLIHAVNCIKDDKSDRLIIFPEGTRLKKGKIPKAKTGAVYIAMKAGVPIIPIKITRKANRSFFTTYIYTYGDPIYYDLERTKDKDYIKNKSDELMNTILNIK